MRAAARITHVMQARRYEEASNRYDVPRTINAIFDLSAPIGEHAQRSQMEEGRYGNRAVKRKPGEKDWKETSG